MDDVLLRLPEVIRRVGLSRPSIYKKMQNGEFPRPVKLGRGVHSAVAWPSSRIEAWKAGLVDTVPFSEVSQ